MEAGYPQYAHVQGLVPLFIPTPTLLLTALAWRSGDLNLVWALPLALSLRKSLSLLCLSRLLCFALFWSFVLSIQFITLIDFHRLNQL